MLRCLSEEIPVYEGRGSLGGQTCCTLAASGGLLLVNAKIYLCSNGTDTLIKSLVNHYN